MARDEYLDINVKKFNYNMTKSTCFEFHEFKTSINQRYWEISNKALARTLGIPNDEICFKIDNIEESIFWRMVSKRIFFTHML